MFVYYTTMCYVNMLLCMCQCVVQEIHINEVDPLVAPGIDHSDVQLQEFYHVLNFQVQTVALAV